MTTTSALFRLIRQALRGLLNASIMAVFFFAAWWLRPDGLPDKPYFAGFVISLPVALAVLSWSLLGFPGLVAALKDQRLAFILAVAVLTGWTLLSPGWATFRNQSTDAAQQWLAVAIFTLVVLCAPPHARWIAFALALGAVWQGVVVVAQWFLQESVGLYSLGEYHLWVTRPQVSIVVDRVVRRLRPYGLIVHPNIVGGYFTVALLALTGWLTDHGLATWRWLTRLIIVALGLWALCLTFSRSAWGAVVGGMVLIALAGFRRGSLRPGRVPVAVTMITAGAVVVAFVASYPGFILSRAGGGGAFIESEAISIAQRRVLISISLDLIRAHPVAGVGMGASDWEAAQILPSLSYPGMVAEKVHNMALLALSELGIVGFCLWATALVTAGLAIWRSTFDPYAVGIAAAAAALLAIGLLDHYPWTVFQFSLVLWGSLALAMHPRHGARVERSAT